jgi:hypothetical protein
LYIATGDLMRKQVHTKPVKLPLDTRNRVCLTQFLPKDLEVSSYKAYQEGNKIILEPLVEISAETIASVKRGLKDIKAGRVSELNRDFSEFLNDDEI